MSATDTELWTTSQVRVRLGLGSAAAARVQLRRWRIVAATDEHGHLLLDADSGEKLWPAGQVRMRQAARPRPRAD